MRKFWIAFGLVAQIGHASAVDCNMTEIFRQEDEGVKRPVLADVSRKSLLFTEKLNVNTDGTKRSYNVSDFWGETNALNNLCNAMSDGCAGLNKTELRARRIITQEAYAQGWPSAKLAATRISASIIPHVNGKPCPLRDGFMVSATALAKPTAADVCDISNYVDALTVPAIVVPKGNNGFRENNARVGDLVVALSPGSTNPVFGVIGDTGPARSLGEASIAMNGALLGRTEIPANYLEVRGKVQGKKSWVVPKATILIFPGTRDATNPYMSVTRIDEMARNKFESWGGITRLRDCAGEPDQ